MSESWDDHSNDILLKMAIAGYEEPPAESFLRWKRIEYELAELLGETEYEQPVEDDVELTKYLRNISNAFPDAADIKKYCLKEIKAVYGR